MSYNAFISYSHAADNALAPAVQRALQTLARRWNRRRALEIFRDETGLAVSPGLWTSICVALDESEHFVLLASPEAATSTWVNQEIDRWLTTHSIDRLLPVLTAGEWNWDVERADFDDNSTAVPPSLRARFAEEPRHLDLRWARTEAELDLRHSRFREAITQLAAPMHGMSPQDLESSDVARFRHLVRLRRAVVVVLCFLLTLVSLAGVLAVHNARQAREQSALAVQQAQRALSLQLLAQAKVVGDGHKTLSLLLTAEAARLNPTEAWSSLVTGSQETPGLTKVYDVPDGARRADAVPTALDTGTNVYASVTQQKANRPVIQLWDLSTGRHDGKLVDDALYGLSATELALGPRGELAAPYVCLKRLCAKDAGGIELWDVSALEGHLLPASAGFSAVALSHSGDRLAAARSDGTMRVWDVSSRRLLLSRSAGFRGQPTSLAFSANDAFLSLGQRENGRILSWKLSGRRAVDPSVIPFPPGKFPEQVAFGPGHLVAARDNRGRVRLWDARSGEPSGRLGHAGTPVVSLASGPEGALATAAADGSLRLWDAARREQVGSAAPTGGRGRAVTVVFDEGGALVSTGSDLRIWDVSRWGEVGSVLYRHRPAVTALAVSPDGVVASGDEHGVIRTWNLRDAKPASQVLRAHRGAVTALAFSPDGVLASGGEDGAVRLWRATTGEELGNPLEGHDGGVTSVAFSSDGTAVAAGYGRGTHRAWHRLEPIHVWDVASRSLTQRLPAGLKGAVTSVAFSHEGLFAAAGADFLAVWPVDKWESHNLVEDPRAGPFTAVAFSANGSLLATSGVRFARGDNGSVVLWSMPQRIQAGAALVAGRAQGSSRAFRALAFSSDQTLLAGVGDTGLQLWSIPLHDPLGGRLGSASAGALAISPDGQLIIVGDSNGAVQVYPATVAGWLENVCGLVARNLSRSEWDSFVKSDTPYEVTCPEYPSG